MLKQKEHKIIIYSLTEAAPFAGTEGIFPAHLLFRLVYMKHTGVVKKQGSMTSNQQTKRNIKTKFLYNTNSFSNLLFHLAKVQCFTLHKFKYYLIIYYRKIPKCIQSYLNIFGDCCSMSWKNQLWNSSCENSKVVHYSPLPILNSFQRYPAAVTDQHKDYH